MPEPVAPPPPKARHGSIASHLRRASRIAAGLRGTERRGCEDADRKVSMDIPAEEDWHPDLVASVDQIRALQQKASSSLPAAEQRA